MGKLKGCLFANEDLNLTGGTEKIVRQVALELSRRGLNIGLVSARTINQSTGLKEYVLPFFNRSSSQKTGSQVKKVISLMKKHDYDLLHVYNVRNHDLVEKLAKSVPTFKTVADSRAVCPAEFKTKPDGSLCNEVVGKNCIDCLKGLEFSDFERKKRLAKTIKELGIMKNFALIFTPSEYTRQQLLINGIKPDKVKVVPFFLSRLLPDAKSVSKNQNKPFQSDILFAGRLIKAKGIKELLAAFLLLDDKYRLIIIGEAPTYAKPKDWVKINNLGKKVKLIGWVDNKKIDNYFQGTRVYVIPSMGPESFGIVGLEAMRNKKPVVAFDSGGISEWLQDGKNGFLVPRGEIKTLARRIQYLLENPGLALKMGEKGYEILVSRFTKEKHVEKLLKFYKMAL